LTGISKKARIDLNFVARTEKAPKTEGRVRDVDLTRKRSPALIARSRTRPGRR
jgi:hypothetical protein